MTTTRNGRRTVQVQGRAAACLDVGHGPVLVFLHGWGLNHGSYRPSLARLARAGVRVVAPALPAFGGTEELPEGADSLADYAAWVADFLTALDIRHPVTLAGHSFGGGVAARVAYDFPDLVEKLVLVNSVGGSTSGGSLMRTLAERPPWDWGLHLRVDRLPHRQFTRVLPVIIEGVLPNLRRNPSAVIKAALLAWRADLRTELAELRRRELPVVILWGEGDKVMPAAALTVLRGALGDAEVIVVPGSHNWLLADPTAFCEVMTNVVGLAEEIEQEPLRPVS